MAVFVVFAFAWDECGLGWGVEEVRSGSGYTKLTILPDDGTDFVDDDDVVDLTKNAGLEACFTAAASIPLPANEKS